MRNEEDHESNESHESYESREGIVTTPLLTTVSTKGKCHGPVSEFMQAQERG
jgi:hypothetical protein